MFVCFNAIPTVAKSSGDPLVAAPDGADFAAVLAALSSGDVIVPEENTEDVIVPEEADIDDGDDKAELLVDVEPETPDPEMPDNVPVPSVLLPTVPVDSKPRQFMPERADEVADVSATEPPVIDLPASDTEVAEQNITPVEVAEDEVSAPDISTDIAPVERTEVEAKTDSKPVIIADSALVTNPVARSRETAAPRQVFHAVEVADVNDKVMIAIRSEDDGMTELVLSPDELGKVTVKVTTQEQGVHVVVTTERPEAENLVRRQIETLVQDLKNQGFNNIGFEFGSRSQGNPQPAATGTHVVAITEEPDIPTVPIRSAPMIDGRIDIRL